MKHFKYLHYILRHKWYVFLACWKSAWSDDTDSISESIHLVWRGLIHDWSKLLPSEWFPYVEKFYGPKWTGHKYMRMDKHGLPTGIWESVAGRVDSNFDLAWLHHQKLNPHHWQYWILNQDSGKTKLMNIPRIFILEMVADWRGAGMAIHGKDDVLGWYSKIRENQQMSLHSRYQVDRLVGYKEDDKENS